MISEKKNYFLPLNQMHGSFSQGGQYSLDQNYNLGFYTNENVNGDYSLNVGKDFFPRDDIKIKTSISHLSEQNTWLGNSSDGALGVGKNNISNSGNIGFDYLLGNNIVSFDYSLGETKINTKSNSLIKSFSDLNTNSYRLAYKINKDNNNSYGWSFSVPNYIKSGEMNLELAESVNLDGSINYKILTSDLSSNTIEKNLGFFYNKKGEDTFDPSFNFTAEYRQDISGQRGNDGLNLNISFTKKVNFSCKLLWFKNPKCFDENEKLKNINVKKNPVEKYGLVYNLKTDKFEPINSDKK